MKNDWHKMVPDVHFADVISVYIPNPLFMWFLYFLRKLGNEFHLYEICTNKQFIFPIYKRKQKPTCHNQLYPLNKSFLYPKSPTVFSNPICTKYIN